MSSVLECVPNSIPPPLPSSSSAGKSLENASIYLFTYSRPVDDGRTDWWHWDAALFSAVSRVIYRSRAQHGGRNANEKTKSPIKVGPRGWWRWCTVHYARSMGCGEMIVSAGRHEPILISKSGRRGLALIKIVTNSCRAITFLCLKRLNERNSRPTGENRHRPWLVAEAWFSSTRNTHQVLVLITSQW